MLRFLRTHRFSIAALFAAMLVLSACSSGPDWIPRNPFSSPNTMPPMQMVQPTGELPGPAPAQTREMNAPVKPLFGGGTRVALMLPLSGPSTKVGKDLLDAAQLALFDVGNKNITLVPLDTKGTEEGSIEAANQAVAEDVDIIVGPLFSKETETVLPIVRNNNIPVVSLSNDKNLQKMGAYVFGFMPEQQVRRVVDYAVSQGIKDFYALTSNDAFGNSAIDVLKDAQQKYMLNVHIATTYGKGNTGLADGLKTIAAHIKSAKKRGETQPRALLVPEGGKNLLQIAKLLAGFGLSTNDVRLLGSGQWDEPALTRNKRLFGSWFASAAPDQRNVFNKHFKKTYGYEPVRIASLTYDAMSLVGYISAAGRGFSDSTLINERGFAGVDGIFRFGPDRVAERALAVLEIIPNNVELVDNPPTAFTQFYGGSQPAASTPAVAAPAH